MVERSLLAAERSVWVAGVVDVGVVVRREVVWPVSVVVAVNMGTWDLLGEVNGKDRPRRRLAARSEKAPGWRRFSGAVKPDQLLGRPSGYPGAREPQASPDAGPRPFFAAENWG
jgi:hypothetical protein